jgi:serine protease Do
VKFNGQPVGGAAELKNMVGRQHPDSTVKLTIFRNKKAMDVSVKIGERSQQVASAAGNMHSEAAGTGELGLELGKVSASDASKLGLKSGEALVVRAVKPDGTGGKLGLRPGDAILEVDGAPVSDVSSFNAKVTEAKKHKVIRLTVQRGKDVLLMATDLA